MIHTATLKNGLKIVIDQIPTVETATLGVWVKVGTRHEAAEVNGVSHFLEHMAFKGTQKRTARQIVEEIEAVGGYVNAFTSREMTAYQARILAADLPLALDIIADILLSPLFLEDEFERERGVIFQELFESHDTPDDIVFDLFQGHLYPHQPLGRPILGSMETIKALTIDGVRAHMEETYAPSNMVFAVAGNVDPADVITRITGYFGGISDFSPAPFVTGVYGGGVHSYVKPLEQTQWLLGFQGIAQTDPNFYTSAVLSALLGGGMSSRLFQEIREKRGLAYTIYTYHACYADTGTFGIYASTQADQVSELTGAVHQELQQLMDKITLPEIDRAKAQLKASTLMGLESTTNRCERIATQTHILGSVLSNAETIACIENVTPQRLRDFAIRIFSSPPTAVTLGPIDHRETLQATIEGRGR